MKIVVSGVNMTEGGILSVLQDVLGSATHLTKTNDVEFTFLVHNKALLGFVDEKIVIQEYPSIKSSWIKRLYFEYVYCNRLSKQLKPDIWIALHDMSPRVDAQVQIVYCHNPSPFFKSKLKDVFIDHKLFLFSFFYKFLYGINIKKNKFVIVQQTWIRKAFEKYFSVKTIIAQPSINLDDLVKTGSQVKKQHYDKYTFFFPSFPRIFKNFDILFEAVSALSLIRDDFQLIVTFDRDQNKLASQLFDKYTHCANIKFIGKQNREDIYKIFEVIDCLVFPSKLETWGLPLTEAKQFNKPIIVSDLEYAHENIRDYKQVKFFDPDDSQILAKYMSLMIDGKLTFDHNQIIQPQQPFFTNWDELLRFLIKQVN